MKLLNIDWAQFLVSLKMYRTLELRARGMFVEQVRPSQPISKKHLEPCGPKLVESGLMAFGQTGVNAQVKPEHREFSRAIRAMSRAGIFNAPSRDTFLQYLNDNLTGSEAASLDGSYYYGRMGYADLNRLFSVVCSAGWIKQFLAAKTGDWERDYADPAQPRYFNSPEIFKTAQQLIRAISAEEATLPLDRLAAMCPDATPEVFSGAMRGIVRYLLIFTAVRPEDLEPVAGLWPGVSEKLLNKPVPPPAPAKAQDAFEGTFLLDDMTAVLSACAAEPLRIRSGDMQIFEADHKILSGSLGSVPEWIERTFDADPDHRISYAVNFLLIFRFVERTGKTGSAYRLVATSEGSTWLAMDVKDRLHAVIDGFLDKSKQDIPLLPGLGRIGTHSDAKKILPEVLKAYAALPPRVFFRLADFLKYQSHSNNVLASVGSPRQSSLGTRRWDDDISSDEESEIAWENLLSGFLKYRLAPFGGIQLGVEQPSNLICFALTGIGSYLVGASSDFEVTSAEAARILVQPNFDVVFLAPSPRLEAELARFCERKGRHIGTLFRITKNSILNAAAAGMTPEQPVELLGKHSAADIPPNVVSEIAGWFRRFRQVNMRQALVIHCPDEATATTLIAAIGTSATKLNATTLELADSKVAPAVVKKLREAGIFIRS